MKLLAVFIASIVVACCAARAQSIEGTSKFQKAILDLRGCIRASEPAATIADIHHLDEATVFLRARCYGSFSAALAAKGETEATPGAFRLVVREEWSAFQCHLGNC
jgi:hypothetical protein